MQIILVKDKKLLKYPFPNENMNKYWIVDTDEYSSTRDLVSLEKKDDKWYIVSSDICKIEQNNEILREKEIEKDVFIKLKIENKSKITYILLFIYDETEEKYENYEIIQDGDYIIGSFERADIRIYNEYINPEHAFLTKKDNCFYIKSKNKTSNVYVNNNKKNEKKLTNGDHIFIFGYKFIILNNNIIINNYNKELKINSRFIMKRDIYSQNDQELLPTEPDDNAKIYEENEFYSRSPRFSTSIIEEEMNIESPPAKVEPDDTPIIHQIGPMITMAMSSIVSASTSVLNLVQGKGTLATVLPSAIIAVAMLGSTLLWPNLTRSYNKKKQKQKEKERQKKYLTYLAKKKREIENLRVSQFQIMNENYPHPKNIEGIILNKRRNLWERLRDSEDFLRVRVGYGTLPLKVKLNYSKEDFTMVEDNLKSELEKVGETAKDIQNSPITIDLVERNKLVLIGDSYYQQEMLKSIILQLATYHSYDDLKFVCMVSDDVSEIFQNIRILPHSWSNARDIRFYANNYDDTTKISFYLEQTFTQRKNGSENANGEKKSKKGFAPYYLIIVDNIKRNKNVEIINKVLKEEGNLGFGLIIINEGISNLPNECVDFLTAAGEKSAIIKNDLIKDNQRQFIMDNVEEIDMAYLCEKIANIPIKLPLLLDEMKSSIGFLEMYKVGRVEQLNILDKWEKNNPVNSLSVPIGIHTDGELFNLDLHEKFHGPHGLIAGMTGSGKSEFIITFILSMSLNFNPEEVSFVLIDYKGGGLTGAFENSKIKLPHLAGTITNLDTAEIKRSLASIQSELKRRQRLFNVAKERLNESTLDIYKYQNMYRDGLINEPISHLFIISDEFAELKSQQPDFMNELISTARIGRSLGVHLILATQKPSGIVDDQIWSNSKFKICLKVQERSDSMDVIKCPDAASLKKAGRFYLQVGYNDYFGMGQGAYAGAKYIPQEKITKNVDRDISFLNNIGDIVKSYETIKKDITQAYGEELPNILKYIVDNAKTKNLVAKKLWLDKIPYEIFVNNLIKKYNFKPKKWQIEAVIGEYDDPNRQLQGLLTLNFNTSGNTLIYGVDGKDVMVSSILYSLIITHASDEINIYVIDFGSEMMGMFKAAPQVGDVVFISEEEKLNNLFGNVEKEFERRKKIFIDYNGSYDLYIKNSGKTLPRIIIIINNYEVLNETYEEYIDHISSLTRECEKYGISFVITATGATAIRARTAQNFNNHLCMQFNDYSDYSTVLGSTKGLIPCNALGRGLTRIDGELFEFQTAYPYIWDEINGFIRDICSRLNKQIGEKAKTIKVLPLNVRMTNVQEGLSDLKNVPIGIIKNTLEIATFNFMRSPIGLVLAQEASMIEKFIFSLAHVIQKIPNTEVYMIDALELAKDVSNFKHYYSSNSLEFLDVLEQLIANNNGKSNVFIINSIDTLKNNMSSTNLVRMKNLLEKIKLLDYIKVIVSDSASAIKQFEYDDFYRNNTNTMYGIWVGSGITDQFVIKSNTYNKETRSQINQNFGFLVERGNATLVKLLDFYTKDE